MGVECEDVGRADDGRPATGTSSKGPQRGPKGSNHDRRGSGGGKNDKMGSGGGNNDKGRSNAAAQEEVVEEEGEEEKSASVALAVQEWATRAATTRWRMLYV